jgi:hypothetical protein
VYAHIRWPADGLRWLGSLLLLLADRLERAAIVEASAPARDERIDECRSRIASRYY